MAHRKWAEVRRTLSPAAEERIREELGRIRQEMPLQELRRARDFTQVALAEKMGEQQSAISRLEGQADMYLSTLRRYVEAMGGELELVARFRDRAVRIHQLHELR